MAKKKTKTNPPRIKTSPFPGLRPFSSKESYLFFGRDKQIDDLTTRLRKSRFVAVLGASGSGKSSLVKSGLFPRLYLGMMANAGSHWQIASTRPGDDPIGNLAESLAELLPPEQRNDPVLPARQVMETFLKSSSHGLIEATKRSVLSKGKRNLLILVDQFEELFRFQNDLNFKDQVLAFVNLLVTASESQAFPIYVIITMRSDFIGETARFPGLPEKINEGQYLVPRMNRDQLRQAIVGPVAVGGGTIDNSLIIRLLNDVGDSPDLLPILAHALMRTWQKWEEDLKKGYQGPMIVRHFEEIGGMDAALDQHAEEIYQELPTERAREVCQGLFKTLTDKGSDNRGIRRPTRLAVIAETISAQEIEILPIVEAFRKTGRTFLMPPIGNQIIGDSIIDISHESFMRVWKRLIGWVDEEAQSAQMYRRVASAAQLHGQELGGLWRPPELALAVAWEKEQQPTRVWAEKYAPGFASTMVFIADSDAAYTEEIIAKEKAQKAKTRRLVLFLIVMGAAAVISVMLALFALNAKQQADTAKEEAVLEKVRADDNAKIATANEVKAKKAEKKALFNLNLAEIAKKEALEAKNEATRNFLLAKENERQAIANAKRALEQETLAKRNAKRARVNEEKALLEKERAVQAQKETYRQRILSIAKSMAVKSMEVSDPNLKALLAHQAYQFFEKYNTKDKKYNPDLYMALYDARKALVGNEYNTYTGQKSVRSLLLNPARNEIISVGPEGKVVRNNLKDKQPRQFFIANAMLRSICQNPSGDIIAFCGGGNDLYFADLNSSGSRTQKVTHTAELRSLDFAQIGNSCYVGSVDGKVYVYQYPKQQYSLVVDFDSPIQVVKAHPDGKMIFVVTKSGKVLAKSPFADGSSPKVIYEDPDKALTITTGKDAVGQYVAVGTAKGNVHLFDLNGEKIQTFEGHLGKITSLDFSHNSNGRIQYLASSSMDGSVRIWNMLKKYDLPILFDDFDSWVWSVRFSPDNKWIAAGSGNGEIRLAPVSGKVLAEEVQKGIIKNFSQDQWKVYVADDVQYQETKKGLTE